MELPVMMQGKSVGYCALQEIGLYWELQCRCELVSDRVERLYVLDKKLGVLERDGAELCMSKRISKSSCPELPPRKGYFTLHPEIEEAEKEIAVSEEATLWEGEILGHRLNGRRDGDYLIFPYDELQPCPCEPLLCFFEVKDGFWRLPINLSEKKQEDLGIHDETCPQ